MSVFRGVGDLLYLCSRMLKKAAPPLTAKRIITLAALTLLVAIRMAAQMVTGVVTDKEFNEPVPGVRIHYADDKRTMVVSDINGKYRIPARRGDLVFSIIGYDHHIVTVKEAADQRIDVRLTEASKSLDEFEVVRKKERYSRKNNPAVEMMRKVIAAKKASDLYGHPYFSYQKYEKMTLSLNEFTEKVFEDDHFKHLPFLRDHVEVYPETGKLILPLTVEEKVSRQIFRRIPKTEKTIVMAQHNEGVTDLINTGDIVNNMLADCFTDVDIYKEDVRLLQYPFISPISTKRAIDFYRYFIIDTLMVDKQECFRIDFTPNNSQDFGFSGALYVLADSTWRVKKVHLNIPARSDVNFVEQLDLIQDFEPLPSGEQVVKDNKMIVQLKLASFIQKLQVERTVRYSNYDFSVIPDRTFKIRGDVKVEASAQMRDNAFWEDYRPVPLTHSEKQLDVLLDRIKNIKGMKYIIWVGKAFIENYVETTIDPDKGSKVDIGPVNTMIGSNFVEGFRLRASAQTTANLSKHWFAKSYVKYGFGDHRWKGMGEVTYSFNAKDYLPREYPVRNLTFNYTNDISSPSDKYIPTDKDNVFFALKWTPVKHMNYFERYNLMLDWEWENGLRLTTQLRREWNEGAGELFYQTLNNGTRDESGRLMPDRNGPMLHKIHFTEAMVGLEFQPGATYINTKQRRLTTNFDAPIMGLSHTVGVKGLLGSQYNYNFTEATIYKRFWLHSWGKIDCMAKGGLEWNKVPYPFLIMPAANLSYIMELYSFNLINNMEFPTDRYASLMLSWDMNGKILNRIPLIRSLKWREFIGVNVLWGKLTDRNNPFLAENAGDPTLMFFPAVYKNGQYEYLSHVMDPKKPYVELMFGIHNIFKLFHIEYVHRMNYIYPETKRWGIRFTFRVTF